MSKKNCINFFLSALIIFNLIETHFVLNKCSFIYYYQHIQDINPIITPFDSLRHLLGWFSPHFYTIDIALILILIGLIYAILKINLRASFIMTIFIIIIFQAINLVAIYPQMYILKYMTK